MNFLELCQDLAREAGTSGAIVSVDRQTGEGQRLVNWIARAFKMIQNVRTDWTFLRTDVAFDTIAGTNAYTAAASGVTEFGEWRFQDRWRCYAKAQGVIDEQPIRYMKYDDFRNKCMYGTQRTATGRPMVVTEGPDQRLLFWPTPDVVYTIVGEQFKAPARLVVNADVPNFPAKFHDAITYRALMLYGEFEGDATVYASAQTEFKRILEQMENLYSPEWEDPEPMA